MRLCFPIWYTVVSYIFLSDNFRWLAETEKFVDTWYIQMTSFVTYVFHCGPNFVVCLNQQKSQKLVLNDKNEWTVILMSINCYYYIYGTEPTDMLRTQDPKNMINDEQSDFMNLNIMKTIFLEMESGRLILKNTNLECRA